jgi:cardiolipin synthase
MTVPTPVQRPSLPGRPLEDAVAQMAELTGSPPRPLPAARVLRDGAIAFDAMIDLIDGAARCVRFENFIFAGDATGERFANALAGAARRGVDVRVLYDPVGTLLVHGGSAARMLAGDAGVDARAFRPFSPFLPWSWSRLRHRDHRKLLAVDGGAGIVGGFCISDNWSPSSRGGKGWRDTALQVAGPIVGDLERAFDAMWRRAGDQRARPAPDAAQDVVPPAAIVAADLPGARHVSSLYHWLAEHARTSIDITDAYLVTPPRILAAFEAAARRGVAVRLLLPGRNNHPVAGAAARHVYAPLLEAGAEIWEWDGLMLHAKTAVVDGEVALVGSSNLDPLSMRRNYELNLLVADPGTGRAMREMFERDLDNATRVDAVAWSRRPSWQRALEAIASRFRANL